MVWYQILPYVNSDTELICQWVVGLVRETFHGKTMVRFGLQYELIWAMLRIYLSLMIAEFGASFQQSILASASYDYNDSKGIIPQNQMRLNSTGMGRYFRGKGKRWPL